MASVPPTSPRSGNKRLVALLLHAVSVATMANAFHAVDESGDMAHFMAKMHGGKWNFLTILGLAVSLAYVTIALLNDLLPSVTVLDVAKNALGIICVPLEGLISILYWGISTYDPKLMAPPGVQLPPLFIDLSLHALPALFLWLDFLFFSPPLSKAVSPTLVCCIFTFGYVTWLEYSNSQNGYYPYPFLGDMPSAARTVFFGAAGGLNILLFHLANRVHFAVDKALGRDVQRAKGQAAGKRE